MAYGNFQFYHQIMDNIVSWNGIFNYNVSYSQTEFDSGSFSAVLNYLSEKNIPFLILMKCGI